MSKREHKLRLAEDAAKVEQMYDERRKENKQSMRKRRKTKIEKAVVAILAILGWMGIMFLGMYLLIHFPLLKNPFTRLIPWVIYFFIMIPLFGWLIILINKHIYGD